MPDLENVVILVGGDRAPVISLFADGLWLRPVNVAATRSNNSKEMVFEAACVLLDHGPFRFHPSVVSGS